MSLTSSLTIYDPAPPAGVKTERVHNDLAKLLANKQSLRYWEMFRQLCPKWHGWIMQDGFEGAYNKHRRSLESTKACIVGELHGGNDDYMLVHGRTCFVCDRYACDTLISSEGTNWGTAIPRLMRHWNDKHIVK